MNYMRTAVLLAGMTALFLIVGALLGGRAGMGLALLFAVGANVFAYWNSDRMALAAVDAHEVDRTSAPDLVDDVAMLAQRAGLPMPRVYVVDSPQPNAFATGRNPENAAVAVNAGLSQMLTREERMGVLAHELAHVKNRDTLIMTMVATIAGAISMIANFGMFFGGSGDDRPNPIVAILAMLMAPFAAMIVQMAISRTREYGADKAGAEISGNPMALATALAKIARPAQQIPSHASVHNPAAAQLYIVPTSVSELFSTHPPTEKRIAALQDMAQGALAGAPRSRSALDPNRK